MVTKRVKWILIHFLFKTLNGLTIMGFNHPYWSISAMGASLFGSAFTGIYPTNGPEEVEHNLNLTDTSVLVIENMKLLSQIELKRKLKLIIVYNEDTSLEKYQDIPLTTMTSFLERYKKPPLSHHLKTIRPHFAISLLVVLLVCLRL